MSAAISSIHRVGQAPDNGLKKIWIVVQVLSGVIDVVEAFDNEKIAMQRYRALKKETDMQDDDLKLCECTINDSDEVVQ